MTDTLMDIICNGDQRSVEEKSTLADLVATLSLDPRTVVAEVNGRIVEHTDFTGQELNAGDRVELIRFVGGG
ncbi:MAG: sulfur carrier protein ThiS [Desulfobulbaceae bacterium]|nr:sulfur carrier protein ThiS [Desulfobulbaceae bacterium]